MTYDPFIASLSRIAEAHDQPLSEAEQHRIVDAGLMANYKPALESLCGRPDLADSVDERIAKVSAAKVRAAWLARGRSIDVIDDALRHDTRTWVHQAILAQPFSDEAAYRRLVEKIAKGHSRHELGQVLLNPCAPDDCQETAIVALAGWDRKLRRDAAEAFDAAIRRDPALCAAAVRNAANPDTVRRIGHHVGWGFSETQATRIIERLIGDRFDSPKVPVRPYDQYNRSKRLTEIASLCVLLLRGMALPDRYSYLLGSELAALRSGPGSVPAAASDAVKAAAGGFWFDDMTAIGAFRTAIRPDVTESEVFTLMRVTGRSSHTAEFPDIEEMRYAVVRALLANPRLTADGFKAFVHGRNGDALSYVPSRLAPIALLTGKDPAGVLADGDVGEVLAEAFAAAGSPFEMFRVLEAARGAGVDLGAHLEVIPASLYARVRSRSQRELVDLLTVPIVERLGTDEVRWQLFMELLGGDEGSLGDLLGSIEVLE